MGKYDGKYCDGKYDGTYYGKSYNVPFGSPFIMGEMDLSEKGEFLMAPVIMNIWENEDINGILFRNIMMIMGTFMTFMGMLGAS